VAYRMGLVRPVYPVQRRADVERPRAQRIVGTAGHVRRQPRLALAHCGRRCPPRPFGLAGYPMATFPLEALAADTDPVLDRLAVAEHVVQLPLGRVDDDGTRRVAGVIGDHPLAAIARSVVPERGAEAGLRRSSDARPRKVVSGICRRIAERGDDEAQSETRCDNPAPTHVVPLT